MDTSNELFLCPFCGASPKIGTLGGDGENRMIWCDNCKIPSVEMGVHGDTKEDIIRLWNTRVNCAMKAVLYGGWRDARKDKPPKDQWILVVSQFLPNSEYLKNISDNKKREG